MVQRDVSGKNREGWGRGENQGTPSFPLSYARSHGQVCLFETTENE